MTAIQTAAKAQPKAQHRDNLLGICAALGEDFGFNPFYLRVALAVGVMFAPEAVLIGYATAGLLVLLSRVLVRRKRPAASRPVVVAVAAPAAPVAEPMLLAA